MSLSDIISSLNEIKNNARDCEEDMWHEENAILEGIFREIADEIDGVIDKLESYERRNDIMIIKCPNCNARIKDIDNKCISLPINCSNCNFKIKEYYFTKGENK